VKRRGFLVGLLAAPVATLAKPAFAKGGVLSRSVTTTGDGGVELLLPFTTSREMARRAARYTIARTYTREEIERQFSGWTSAWLDTAERHPAAARPRSAELDAPSAMPSRSLGGAPIVSRYRSVAMASWYAAMPLAIAKSSEIVSAMCSSRRDA